MPVNIARPSAMSLIIQLRRGSTTLGTGTAFVAMAAHGPVLITNRHNVTGRRQDNGDPLHSSGAVPDSLAIMHNQLNRLGHWIERVEPLYNGTTPRWMEHPTLGARVDCVALRLTQTTDAQFYPYDPVNAGPAIAFGPADVVSVVGFPFGLTGGGFLAIWATGFVASEPTMDYDNLPQFLIDCRSRQGQSGSPLIAYRGGGAVALEEGNTSVFNGPVFRFLGIYSGRINAQSDLGYVWNTRAVSDVLSAS
jgi:hypothetical protein